MKLMYVMLFVLLNIKRVLYSLFPLFILYPDTFSLFSWSFFLSFFFWFFSSYFSFRRFFFVFISFRYPCVAQIVFNVVASVKFNEKLRDAVEINVLGTKKILDLVMGIKNLKVCMQILKCHICECSNKTKW